MDKLTFKQYLQEEDLQESDESRILQLQSAVKRGVPGSVEKMDSMLSALKAKDAIKGRIAQTAREYETWKKTYAEKRSAHQRQKDGDFSNAKSSVEVGDDEHGSSAFKKETGSIRRGPKGSMGTVGTVPTR